MRLLSALVISFLFGTALASEPSLRSLKDSKARLVPRKILALYKGSEGRSEENNEIHRMAQLPLNNLGLVVEYADAEGPLPSPDQMQQYRGVLTWFVSDQMKDARRYRSWLRQVLRNKLRVVIFGQFGAFREFGKDPTQEDRQETREIFQRLGLITELRTWVAENVEIAWKDEEFYDYETTLTADRIRYFFDIRSADPANRVLLALSQPGMRNDAAVLTPSGGFVQSGTSHWLDQESGRAQWFINPFSFFRAAFDSQNLPVADLNTVGGYRTAFIHVDGDGFSTISKIDRWHLSADLLQRRILKKFSLPFSVSVITAEVDPAYFGNEETVEVARSIYRLPNVEPASHSFSHPLEWHLGIVSFDSIPGYRFDPRQEIIGSMNYIQAELLPPWKTISLFFWSGRCNATAEQIRLVEDRGWLQINGGGGFLDPARPSITAFAPPYLQIGDQFQIHARVSNEFEFTNGWQGPFDGYRQVVASFQFTEEQGPLIPADIYFHHYSMEWEEGWKSLRYVLQWAEHQEWTFLYTSQYVRMVKDFLSMEIYQESDNRYIILTNGSLRTIRFPNEPRLVDMAASRNILGFTRTGRDLLVHLDGRRRHEIVLGSEPQRSLYLISANRLVDSLAAAPDSIRLYVQGYGYLEATLANVEPGQYFRIDVVNADETLTASNGHAASSEDRARVANRQAGDFRRYLRSDADGILRLRAFITNRGTVVITPATAFAYAFSRTKIWLLGVVLIGFVLFQLRRNQFGP
jgi:hypothetical protein